MDGANAPLERSIALAGGAMVSKRAGLLGVNDVWSYPNIHGDVVATASTAGLKQGLTHDYDPFGVVLVPPVVDNSPGNFDYGWLGQPQRGTEHATGIATIEMGARQYVPGMGRFLSVDPVEGGSANDYDYCSGDSINCADPLGTEPSVYPGSTTIRHDFQSRTIGYLIPLRVGQHGTSPEWGAVHILKEHPRDYDFATIQRVLLEGIWNIDRPGVYKVVLKEQRTRHDKCGCRRTRSGTFTVIVDTNKVSSNGDIIGIRNAYSKNWWDQGSVLP
jgi:RHS repeat-associated protein